MCSAKMTRDHAVIRRWAEARDGEPTVVRGVEGLLRLAFAEGGRDPALERVSWARWLELFDAHDLVFVYGSEPASRFFKVVSEETAGTR